MLTSWSVLLAVVSLIALLAGGVAVVVVLLVRRSDRQLGHGPVAAPGQPERNTAAGRLVAELDDATTRAGTTLEFARLQLSSTAPADLEAAIAEARTSASVLASTLAATRDGQAHGPAGTEVAGRLTAALDRAAAASARLAAAETRVHEETRRLGPPAP